MPSLNDIQNTAFLAIGPCRIAALSLLALSGDESGSASEESQAVLRMSCERVLAAHAMLTKGLPQLLAPHDYKFTPEIAAKQQAAIDAVTPLARALDTPDDEVLDRLRGFGGFTDLCLHQLEPAITDFLQDMTVALRATHAQAEEERRSNILSAVAQAETVGRSIHLIAFNAAIEAARVGDAGRGFKVISSEVQLLAAKTQTLLKDIADTLRD